MGTGTENPLKREMIQNLISVIVPVYNGEAYLNRCVQSMLAQTYQAWELLLIDGASIDNTGALCDEWQIKENRIHAFHTEENRGVSAGRNKGLLEAKGEYIFFLDADDWLKPDCLERLYADIQAEGVQIAGCSFVRSTQTDWQTLAEKIVKQPMPEQHDSVSKKLIAGKDFLEEGILAQDTRCWSKLYRAELLCGHFFKEDYTIGEDMLFLWETAQDAKWISSSAYEGYCYYYNVSGTMLKPFRESDMDQIRCWQLVLQTVQEELQAVQEEDAKKQEKQILEKTAAILLISCMLVVGKLAKLSGKERKRYQHLKRQCSKVLKETLQIEGAYNRLDRSYRLKVRLYEKLPEVYLCLYHLLKA